MFLLAGGLRGASKALLKLAGLAASEKQEPVQVDIEAGLRKAGILRFQPEGSVPFVAYMGACCFTYVVVQALAAQQPHARHGDKVEEVAQAVR